MRTARRKLRARAARPASVTLTEAPRPDDAHRPRHDGHGRRVRQVRAGDPTRARAQLIVRVVAAGDRQVPAAVHERLELFRDLEEPAVAWPAPGPKRPCAVSPRVWTVGSNREAPEPSDLDPLATLNRFSVIASKTQFTTRSARAFVNSALAAIAFMSSLFVMGARGATWRV